MSGRGGRSVSIDAEEVPNSGGWSFWVAWRFLRVCIRVDLHALHSQPAPDVHEKYHQRD